MKLKYVINDKDRHGNVRWYFRRRGFQKIRLPGAPQEPQFHEAYYAALSDKKVSVPKPKMPDPKPRTLFERGYVYFLRCGSVIKIGFSIHPFQRVGELKTALPDKIHTLVAVPGTRSDERKLHKEFEKWRKEGEWFEAHPNIMHTMARMAAYGREWTSKNIGGTNECPTSNG